MGTRGDVAPLFLLAGNLAQRGHEVVVGSSGFYNDMASSTLARQVRVGAGEFEDLSSAMRGVVNALADKSDRDMAFVRRWMLPQIEQSREAVNACLTECDYAVTNVPMILRRPGSGEVMPGAFVSYEPPDSPGKLPDLANGLLLSLVAMSPMLLDPAGILGLDRRITGFWHAGPRYSAPDLLLEKFLDAGPAPVVLTLGSMAVFEDPSLALEFSRALRSVGQRGVLVGGWGKGGMPEDVGDHMMVIDEADYGWLLPRSACVIHHGGSGTVAAVLRAGVPCLVRTYIGSQQRFADLLKKSGVCTGVLDHQPLRAKDLAQAIRLCVSDQPAREMAIHWRAAMANEPDGLTQGVDLLEAHARLLANTVMGARPSWPTRQSQPGKVLEGGSVVRVDTVEATTGIRAAPAEEGGPVAGVSANPPGDEVMQASLSGISEADVIRFYEGNPDLFARRRIYTLLRVSLPSHALNEPETINSLQLSGDVAAWSHWLEDQGIPFRSDTIKCAAEDIPADLLPKLAAMSTGQWLRIDEQQRATVLGLTTLEPASRAIEHAGPDIRKFLQNLQLAQLAQIRAAASTGTS